MGWTIEFYEDEHGRQPVREWLRSLDGKKRAAAIAEIDIRLSDVGPTVCATEHGRHLGEGLFEFRIRHDDGRILLRIFCHAYGQRIVLLLGGYDKGSAPSKKRQQREIDTARKRLRAFRLRSRAQKRCQQR